MAPAGRIKYIKAKNLKRSRKEQPNVFLMESYQMNILITHIGDKGSPCLWPLGQMIPMDRVFHNNIRKRHFLFLKTQSDTSTRLSQGKNHFNACL
jgi:hypothetical protein